MAEDVAELVTFTSKEAYVYAPIPAATSYGHRAELWNPDKWLQEVKVRVVTAGDQAFVRLLDKDSGELFAECPLPSDGTPLTTVVEPVVDSSRYFVVKVVDRDSRKHAFIGLGFRERLDASDFSAALDDYRQYLRRKQEAEAMRQEFERFAATAAEQQDANGSAAAASAAGPDFSLKPGQTIKLNLSSSLKRTGSGKAYSSSAPPNTQQQQQQQLPSSLKLPPPPGKVTTSSNSGTFFKLQPPPAAGRSSDTAAAAGAGAAGGGGGGSSSGMRTSLDGERVQAAEGAGYTSQQSAAAAAAAGIAVVDDEWGDFVS